MCRHFVSAASSLFCLTRLFISQHHYQLHTKQLFCIDNNNNKLLHEVQYFSLQVNWPWEFARSVGSYKNCVSVPALPPCCTVFNYCSFRAQTVVTVLVLTRLEWKPANTRQINSTTKYFLSSFQQIPSNEDDNMRVIICWHYVF